MRHTQNLFFHKDNFRNKRYVMNEVNKFHVEHGYWMRQIDKWLLGWRKLYSNVQCESCESFVYVDYIYGWKLFHIHLVHMQFPKTYFFYIPKIMKFYLSLILWLKHLKYHVSEPRGFFQVLFRKQKKHQAFILYIY